MVKQIHYGVYKILLKALECDFCCFISQFQTNQCYFKWLLCLIMVCVILKTKLLQFVSHHLVAFIVANYKIKFSIFSIIGSIFKFKKIQSLIKLSTIENEFQTKYYSHYT